VKLARQHGRRSFSNGSFRIPTSPARFLSTSNPARAAENIAALRGPPPDREMRARMVSYMESIPGFSQIDKMPWYPDKRYNGLIAQSQAALHARS
jgi:hypothetical protein